MNPNILVVAEHLQGKLADITFELVSAARATATGSVGVIVAGADAAALAGKIPGAECVFAVEDPRLAEFTPELHAAAIEEVVRSQHPGVLLLGATSKGLDLASLLAAKLEAPVLAPCRSVKLENGSLAGTVQLLGGKLLADAVVEGSLAIVALLPGAYPAERQEGTPKVEVRTPSSLPVDARSEGIGLKAPDSGDVDITQMQVLVALGRGIQNRENIPAAEELAAALKGAVAASRPVVDQGWLPMTRQVGRSGLTVKPAAYLAFGISGAPEHLEGMRNAPFIVAVNTDPKAPIFSAAHVGAVADAAEIMSALTGEINRLRAS
jgi:electron transfer flavoprotein alpha subunit